MPDQSSITDKIYDAIIIGGGIAGCSAAIQLCKNGHSVLVLERRKQIGDKLCGEFLSGESAGYLTQLGLLDDVIKRGAKPIDCVSITEVNGATLRSTLPVPALGISRQAMDSALANRAIASGAIVKFGEAVDSVEGSLTDGFRINSNGQFYRARLVFGAYGKSSGLDKSLKRTAKPSPFVAFKGHYRGTHKASTVEMFAFSGGYVGFAPIEDGLVNACFIVDKAALKRADNKADLLIQNVARENAALGERLNGLEPASKMIGCSSISFETKGCFHNDICMIGDTAGMIAPVCGDGMAMAMQSALMAAKFSDRFLAGNISAQEFKIRYTHWWRHEYSARLTVGRALQQISRSSTATSLAVCMCSAIPGLTNALVHTTRSEYVESR